MGWKRPAVDEERRRDARVYQQLAAVARAQGFPRATEHSVHRWVSAGLLPESETQPSQFGQHIKAPHVDAERQLLTLCRYRYTDKLGRYDLVGAQLWLDGFGVSTAFVRGAVGREFVRDTPRPQRDEVAISFQIARQRPIIDAMPRLSFDERADVIDEIRSVVENGEQPSRHGLELIASASALDTKEAARLLQTLPRVTSESALQVQEASDEDLLSARSAFSHLISNTTPDQHKNGRTRARIRLGLFVVAFLLDAKLREPQ